MKEFFRDLKEFGTLPKRGQIYFAILMVVGTGGLIITSRSQRDLENPPLSNPTEFNFPPKTATLQIRPDSLQGSVVRGFRMSSFTPSPAPSPDTN